jgi:hypothetical protein
LNYTKGPWEDVQMGTGKIAIVSAGFTVATIECYGPIERLQETYHNIHLIAAAPEMYKKLLKIRDWLVILAEREEASAKTEKFITLREAEIHDAKVYRATIADIDTVLNKAEGK